MAHPADHIVDMASSPLTPENSPPEMTPAPTIPSTRRVFIPLNPKTCNRVSYKNLLQQQFPETQQPSPHTTSHSPEGNDTDARGEVPVEKPPSFGDDAFFNQLLKNAAHYGDDIDEAQSKRGKRMRVFDDYDLYDPFIDDSDAQVHMDKGTRLREEGFFVYYGPLEFVSDDDAAETPPSLDTGPRASKKRKVASKKKDGDKGKGKPGTTAHNERNGSKNKGNIKEIDDNRAGTVAASKSRKKRTSGDEQGDESGSTKKTTSKTKGRNYDSDSSASVTVKKKTQGVKPVGGTGDTGDKGKKRSTPATSTKRPSSSQTKESTGRKANAETVTPSNISTAKVEPSKEPVPDTNPPPTVSSVETTGQPTSDPEPERKTIRPSIFNLIDHSPNDDDDNRDFMPVKYNHTSPMSDRGSTFRTYSDKLLPRNLAVEPGGSLSADHTPSKPSSIVFGDEPVRENFTLGASPTLTTQDTQTSSAPASTDLPKRLYAEGPAATMLMEEFHQASQRESFVNHKKFPSQLKPLLTRLAMKTMEEAGAVFTDVGRFVSAYNNLTDESQDRPTGTAPTGAPPPPPLASSSSNDKPKLTKSRSLAYSVVTRDGQVREVLDNDFYTRLTNVVPYNRATIRKIVGRLTLQERIRLKQTQSQEAFDALRTLVLPGIEIQAKNRPAPASGSDTGPPTAPTPPLAPKPLPMEGVGSSPSPSSANRSSGIHLLLNHPETEADSPSKPEPGVSGNPQLPIPAPVPTSTEPRHPSPSAPVRGQPPQTEEECPAPNKTIRKFSWTNALREALWTFVQIDMEIHILTSELSTLEGKDAVVKEGVVRRAAYQKVLSLWPDGWMTSLDISREYGFKKRRKEKQVGLVPTEH
ncbi:hypothetical protein IWQ61_006756 [Dispira simplex]|nr:hypothetical protein IWQ61_006756 [Dispira simplex]